METILRLTNRLVRLRISMFLTPKVAARLDSFRVLPKLPLHKLRQRHNSQIRLRRLKPIRILSSMEMRTIR